MHGGVGDLGTGRDHLNQSVQHGLGEAVGRATYNFDDLKSQSDSQVKQTFASNRYLPQSHSNLNAAASMTDDEHGRATPELADALRQASLQTDSAVLGDP